MLLQSSNHNETDSVGTPQAQISPRSNASASVNGGSPSKKSLHSRTQSTGSQFSSSNLSNTLGLTVRCDLPFNLSFYTYKYILSIHSYGFFIFIVDIILCSKIQRHKNV